MLIHKIIYWKKRRFFYFNRKNQNIFIVSAEIIFKFYDINEMYIFNFS